MAKSKGSNIPKHPCDQFGPWGGRVGFGGLLFSDRSLWDLLKPTIESLCSDSVLSVRSVTAGCLLAVLDTHRGDALSGFHRLAEGSDPILGTWDVERFINYAVFRDYPAIRPVLLRMLESSQTSAVRAGARNVTLAALWLDEAQEDESSYWRGEKKPEQGRQKYMLVTCQMKRWALSAKNG